MFMITCKYVIPSWSTNTEARWWLQLTCERRRRWCTWGKCIISPITTYYANSRRPSLAEDTVLYGVSNNCTTEESKSGTRRRHRVLHALSFAIYFIHIYPWIMYTRITLGGALTFLSADWAKANGLDRILLCVYNIYRRRRIRIRSRTNTYHSLRYRRRQSL